jgi:hypothetical protein
MKKQQPSLTPQLDYAHHAAAWESSGQNQAKYCDTHKLDYGQLVAARSRLLTKRGTSRPQSSFIPVTATPSSSQSRMVIHIAKDATVELSGSVGVDELCTLFKALRLSV